MHFDEDDVPRRIAVWMLAALALAFVGAACGDPGVAPLEARTDLPPGAEGRLLRLVRRSTRCATEQSVPLEARVASGAEFSGETVDGLGSPCPGSPSPPVDIHVEEDWVVFDFSSVESAGSFPSAQFEGYAIYFVRACPDMALESGHIDREHSTMDLADWDVRSHYDRLDVNFAGTSYDRTSFLKIDLSYVEVDCMRGP